MKGRHGNFPHACTGSVSSTSLSSDESVLMDLKALLLEAKQKVPPVLQVLHCGDETMLDIGGERPWGLQAGSTCTGTSIAQPCGQPGAAASGVGETSPGMAQLSLTTSLSLQMSGAVPSVVAWAIASLTAPSWKPCRPSKSATSAARTTWPTALWTSSLRTMLPYTPPLWALKPFQAGQFPNACPAQLWPPLSRHLATRAVASSA